VSRVWRKGKDGYRLKPSQAYSTVYWQAAEGFGPGESQGKWKTQPGGTAGSRLSAVAGCVSIFITLSA